MDSNLDIEINLENNGPHYIGETLKGEIEIIPQKDLEMLYLRYKLALEVRGLTETRTYDIQKENLVDYVKLKEKEKYVYPIQLLNNEYESYRGINVVFLVRFEVFVKFKDVKKSSQEVLSKIGYTYVKKAEKTGKSVYLNFKSKTENYEVLAGKSKVHLKSAHKLVFSVIGIILMIGLMSSKTEFFETYKYILLGIGILVIMISLSYSFFSTKLVGEIEVEYKDIENRKLEINLRNKEDWKQVKKIESSYKIYEEVVDNRGSSSTEIITNIYKSESKVIKSPKGELRMLYDYPEYKLPTMRLRDVSVYWLLELKITSSLGLVFRYTNEFEVQKS